MQIPETTKTKVRQLIAANKKIEAVKLVKEEFDLSLKTALEVVEAIEAKESVQFNSIQRETFANRHVRPRVNTFSLLSKVFLGVGTLLLALGAALAWDTDRQLANSERVTGTVVDLVSGSGNGAYPLVEYSYKGQQRTVSGGVTSSPPVYELGEQVGIYVPNDPTQEVLIDSLTELWFVPLILSFIGFVFVFIGGVAYLVNR